VDLEQEAYSRGFADGEKSGFDLGERAGREGVSARLEKALKSLEKMNSDLQRLQNNVCRELERETVQLALEVARKIVGREVQTDVQAVTRMVRTGLSRLENAEHITIRMNPEDMQRVAEFAPRMLAEITDAERVRLKATPRSAARLPDRVGFRRHRCALGAAIKSSGSGVSIRMEQGSRASGINHGANNRLEKIRARLEALDPIQVQGKVTQMVGLVVESAGPACRLGAVCDIFTHENEAPLAAEALGFRERHVLLMPLEDMRGIGPGCRVVARQPRATVGVGPELLGRVVDGLGVPIDGRGPVSANAEYPIYTPTSNPMQRRRIQEPLDLGFAPSTVC